MRTQGLEQEGRPRLHADRSVGAPFRPLVDHETLAARLTGLGLKLAEDPDGAALEVDVAPRNRLAVSCVRHNVFMDRSSRRASAVTQAPDIQGGTPVFAGTRVPVAILFDHLEEGESLESFLREHPSVSREQVLEVLEAAKAGVARTT